VELSIYFQGPIRPLANVVRRCRVAIGVAGAVRCLPLYTPCLQSVRLGGHRRTAGKHDRISHPMICVDQTCSSIWEGHGLRSRVAASPATGITPLSASRQNVGTECREPEEGREMPLQMEGA
jgi:hypothetical protein